jgi:acetylornithine deacetylase/succinyl-diaminopimelate desuccinylase-like protein
MNKYIEDLSYFISLRTVKGDLDNQYAISFMLEKLLELGFDVEVKGDDQSEQPVIVAKLGQADKGIVLYNHYDVEGSQCNGWETPPFTLTQKGGRLFGRGVADNKAVLLARLYALESIKQQGKKLPSMMWLIQGEEEVGGEIAHNIFPDYMKQYQANLYLEETGYYRKNKLQIYVEGNEKIMRLSSGALRNLFLYDEVDIKRRHLRKFGKCPFICNIPESSCYIAFGPNDYQANIHQKNESISLEKLRHYLTSIEDFFLMADFICVD